MNRVVASFFREARPIRRGRGGRCYGLISHREKIPSRPSQASRAVSLNQIVVYIYVQVWYPCLLGGLSALALRTKRAWLAY